MRLLPNFLKIASTGIFIQFISFLFYPIIGRVYSPEEFGTFSFFSSLVVIASVIVTGQFYNAVANPKDDEEANQLLSFSVWLTTLSAILFLACLLILRTQTELDSAWFIFPFYLVVYSFFECFKLMSVRHKNYNPFNIAQIINRLGSNILKIVKPLSNGSAWLLISEVVCLAVSNFYLKKKSQFRIIRISELNFSLLRKYKNFPLFYSTSLFIQFLISELPSLYFKAHQELETLGYYSMGNKLFVQPCLLIGYSLHPLLIHKFRDNLNFRSLAKVFSLIALLSVTAFCGAQLLNEKIIAIFIGKKWMQGEHIYSVQLWLILTKFFLGSVLALIISQDKSKHLMITRLLELVVLYIFVFVYKTNFLVTFVVCELLTDLSLIIISLKLSKQLQAKPIND